MIRKYYDQFWQWFSSPQSLWAIGVIVGSILLGFILTFPGLHQWDEEFALRHSNWILQQYGLYHGDYVLFDNIPEWKATKYYGPLWEFVLGIGAHYVFPFLHDPIWVRHALNFSLFPISIFCLFWLLRKMHVACSLSLLLAVVPLGIIRLGGHSLFNTRDAPAALGFLLSTVALWLSFHAVIRATSKKQLIKLCIWIAILVVVPSLLRMPLFLHLLLSIAVLATINWKKQKTDFSRWPMIIIVCFAAGFITFLCFPPAWTTSPRELWDILYTLFSYDLHWDHTPLFEHHYPSDNLPWWYAIFWIPIITHPLLLFCVASGAVLQFCSLIPLGKPLLLRIGTHSVQLSLQRWTWLCTGFAWIIVLLLKPELYDAERQILFLYPTLFFLCMLGLHVLRTRTQWLLASVLIIVSSFSYIGWGRYSYIYTSPFFPGLTGDMQGDYWGLCKPHAINVLLDHIPPGTYVRFSEPYVTGAFQRDRLTNTHNWTYDPAFNYSMGPDVPLDGPPYATIFNNSYRSRIRGPAMIDIRNGKAEIRWQASLPTGEKVCTLIFYSEMQ